MTKDKALQIALKALEATLETLDNANSEPGGPIADTIWHTESETLFDYLADRINVIRKAIDTSGQRVEELNGREHETAQQQEPAFDAADFLLIRRSATERTIRCLNSAENADLRLVLRDLYAVLESTPFTQPEQQQESDGWTPIERAYPQSGAIDIMLADGSVLCEVLPQADGHLWWGGAGTGEKFIDPAFTSVAHWRAHKAGGAA